MNKNIKIKLINILKDNFEYTIEKGYYGYDPRIFYYLPLTKQAANSPTIIKKILKKIEITIVKKIFPNLLLPYIKLLGIDAMSTIPYGLGMFIQSNIKIYKILKDEKYLLEAKKITKILESILIQTNFGKGIPNPLPNGQSIKFKDNFFDNNTIYLPGGAEVFFGYISLYEETKDKKYLLIANEIVESFLHDFTIKKISSNKISFDYSNKNENSHVLNANALAGACIAKMYSYTKNNKYKQTAQKIYNYIEEYLYYSSIPYSGIEDSKLLKSWKSCDTYHTGFTLRGMYDIANILDIDNQLIIDNVKKMMDDFILNDHIIIFKGIGQVGQNQDIHAVAEYIHIFALFFEYFSKKEQNKYLSIIMKNINNFVKSNNGTYYYQVNKKNKFYLYMPRWAQAPMMNAISTLLGKL